MQEPPQNSNLETCSVPDSESCNTSSKFRFSSSFDTRRSVRLEQQLFIPMVKKESQRIFNG
ncbi:Uncharacterized protein TCM_040843 [Theobroma cacao]|uniref:Uncharacterized protein n=1 Tax=Theobroma cacao TaxID=3641 RepID=A0A061GUH9_THECC|nr:Uncharacterized protein TCM_040843 [Theobroma cacao]